MHPRRPFAPDATGSPRVRGHRVVGPVNDKDFGKHWAISTTLIVTAVVSVVMSVAAAAVQYTQQQQMAAQQAAAQATQQRQMVQRENDAILQNSALANAAYVSNATQLQNRQAEMDQSAAAKEHDVQIQSAKTQSTAEVAAGESGVQGLGVTALLSDYAKQEADYRFQSQTQVGDQRAQTEADLRDAQLTAEGRVDSVKPYDPSFRPIDYPSLLGAGLRVGADAFGAYNKFQRGPGSAPLTQVPDMGGAGVSGGANVQ